MMSKTWKITNRKSGQYLGDYEGETEADAVRAMWRDAGYRTDQDAADACGCTVADLVSECDVREVSP